MPNQKKTTMPIFLLTGLILLSTVTLHLSLSEALSIAHSALILMLSLVVLGLSFVYCLYAKITVRQQNDSEAIQHVQLALTKLNGAPETALNAMEQHAKQNIEKHVEESLMRTRRLYILTIFSFFHLMLATRAIVAMA
ncbi:hypothetical protein N9M08_07015 [Porticoccaceae bacterium]|nr:hypothetical protein [Porticoccaceae bacterium]MDA8682269.1 hypothetical protein [Porticoccaceae bacterium]MDA8788886.1 hypothetical protein [Porticoccaceae bacterium]MDB2343796.1 hypothetical protein [Porticoccaceae bacterium]